MNSAFRGIDEMTRFLMAIVAVCGFHRNPGTGKPLSFVRLSCNYEFNLRFIKVVSHIKIYNSLKILNILSLFFFPSASYASIQGNRIYQYDAGCALFEVHEQIPEIIDGVATGPALHTLSVATREPGNILDGVSVSSDGAINITESSVSNGFTQGFIELARVPSGIQLVVMAQNPKQPFSWRLNAKCHKGAVGVLHFDEIKSTPPRTDVADKAIDQIFFGSENRPENGPTKDDYSRPITINPPRSDIDQLLAGLERPASAPLTNDVPSNTDSIGDALLKADRERIHNEQVQNLAIATDAAASQQYRALSEAQQVASRHLNELIEARRREAERIAAEQERRREKSENAAAFWKGAGAVILGAGGVNAGMDANQATKMAMDFYKSVDTPEGRVNFPKNLNEGVYYQPSHSQSSSINGMSVAQNTGEPGSAPSYSQAVKSTTSTKVSRCAVNGYVGNERTVYWNGSSLSCGDGSAPRVSGYAYWAGMHCGGDTTGPTDARQCSSAEYSAAERSAASRLPADMARQYGLDH